MLLPRRHSRERPRSWQMQRCHRPQNPGRSTRWSSEPGSPACTWCTGCASRGSPSTASSAATAWAGPGTGTATRARAATRRSCTTRSPSCPTWNRSGRWTSGTRRQPEILRYLETCRRPPRPAPGLHLRRRVTAVEYDEAASLWTLRTDAGRHRDSALRHHRGRLPVRRERARVPRRGHLRRPQPAHRELAARAGRLHRQAGRRDRHRRVGHPGDPGDRRAGRAADRVPAHRAVHHPGRERAAGPALRRAVEGRTTRNGGAGHGTPPAGFPYAAQHPVRPGGARRPSARAVYEAAWGAGGFTFLSGTFADLVLDEEANETAADFVRSKIDEIVARPRDRRRCSSRGTSRSAPSALPLDTGYYETFNRPNVTLVDLRRTPIEEITATGIRTSAGEHELDVIVYATGFDALTGPLEALGIRGRGRAGAGRRLAGRPADLPGPGRARVPEPVHHHRAGQPVGAQQHAGVDRAARGVDRRLPGLPARAAAPT